MKRLLVALVAAAWIAIAAGTGTAPAAHAKTCSAGYVHANLSWGEKCLKVGQYCKIRATASTTATASTVTRAGSAGRPPVETRRPPISTVPTLLRRRSRFA
ncbi:MAG: hypothetical protein QOH02_330 [Gaiellaceae bacterium]|nr:hypothetical protein [Gaiellaceae bacterium]